MRGSHLGWVGIGAAALAGLLGALAASAAGFVLRQPSSTTTQSYSTTATSSATVATTLTLAQINASLAALAGGVKTLGGPGTFLAGANGESRIYETSMGPPVCVTVRNLSNGEIRVSPSSSNSIDVLPLETRSVCIEAPMAIQLSCRQGTLCEGVWRVDRL